MNTNVVSRTLAVASVLLATKAMDTYYPDFAKQAEADKNELATKLFNGASKVQVDLIKLFLQATELESWKAEGKQFNVCDVCSLVMADLTLEKCPLCSAPKTKFDLIK